VINTGSYISTTGDKLVISILHKNNSYVGYPMTNSSIDNHYEKMKKCSGNKKPSFMTILLINGSQFTFYSRKYDTGFYNKYKNKLLKSLKSNNYYEFVKCLDIIAKKTHEKIEYTGKMITLFTFIIILMFTLFPNICFRVNNRRTDIPLIDEFGRVHKNDINEKKTNKIWQNITQFFYRLHPYTSKYNSERCPICLCEWCSESVIVLPCYHKYHYDCLKQSKKKQTCPLCSKNHNIKL